MFITLMNKHNLSKLTINTGGQSEVRKAIKEGEKEREEERWIKEKRGLSFWLQIKVFILSDYVFVENT